MIQGIELYNNLLFLRKMSHVKRKNNQMKYAFQKLAFILYLCYFRIPHPTVCGAVFSSRHSEPRSADLGVRTFISSRWHHLPTAAGYVGRNLIL